MKTQYFRKLPRFLVVLVSITICVTVPNGCSAGNISQIVAKYDSAVQQSIPSIKDFYLRANEFQRELYFDSLACDSTLQMGLVAENGKETPLLHKYSEREINSRLLALSLISNYSKALLQLSDTTKVKTAESDLRSIGNRIAELSRKLGVVASVAPVVGPYAIAGAGLAGLAAKYWTHLKQEAALKDTIREGAPKIALILNRLEIDTSMFSEGVYKNDAQSNLSQFITKYNKTFVNEPSSKTDSTTVNRLEFLRRVEISAERYNSILNVNPSGAIKKMRKINQDLLDWAQSTTKRPFDISQLTDDVDSYLDDVDTITNAASIIKSNSLK